MLRTLSTILLGLSVTTLVVAADQSDVDLVILDNQQRIPGKLDEDPESADWALIKTINGTLRLRKTRISSVELGVTSRFKALKDDDLDGLIAFARWARSKNKHAAALAALDKAFNLIRINPKRPFDLSALALYARITDELKGPEAALPLYRWYRSYGGKDTDTIARLDQLEAIVGRSDETGVPPPPAAAAPAVLPEPEKVASSATEGLETKGWQPENPQYSNPALSEVVPLLADEKLAGVKRALKVTFSKGDKDKAAIKKPVNLDASDEHVLSFQVRKQDTGSIRVAIAVKTGNWVYYESTVQTVKADDGWKELRFDLKAATFKSQKSEWANTATVSDIDEVKEIQVLLYNRDADGSALISGMRFLSDKEL